MDEIIRLVCLVSVLLLLVQENNAATPLFLQAITSALATIPFTGGPVTMGAGLVGAKLAIGSKLLYYLGFFGRRRTAVKPRPSIPFTSNFAGGPLPGGMPPLPLPYALFGPGAFQPPQQPGGGGFSSQSSGFFPQQGPFSSGFDPAQLYQLLVEQGIDPMTAFQAMSGGGGSPPFPEFPQRQIDNGPPMSFSSGPQGGDFGRIPDAQSFASVQDVSQPGAVGSDEDIESFFTFLRDMDDNSCISRLICDIGADPAFLGDFSQNIDSIMSTLDATPSSGAFQYLTIMETGRREGNCAQRFSQCNDSAYDIVKSVAPSVGVPPNIN